MNNDTKPRIYIECTHTFFYGGASGIQRVVRNVVNRSSEIEFQEAEVIPLVWIGFDFYRPRGKIRSSPHPFVKIREFIHDILDRPGKPLPTWLTGPISHLAGIFLKKRLRKKLRRFAHNLPYLVMGLGYLPGRLILGRSVTFREGDVVVLVDSTWGCHAMLASLFKSRKNPGIKLGVMFHDLFPLILPDTCEEITVRGYREWFPQIVPTADFFITNSEATRDTLHRYLEAHPSLRSTPCPSGSFRLGAELDLMRNLKTPDPLIEQLWGTPGKALLSIGTIEPRKNHSFLLDAFDLMRGKGDDISLILIGRSGWKTRDVMERIEGHPDFGTRLLHFGNASDQVLSEAIDRCSCLICPSIAEGFGLPVVEGLMRGLEVFASDIPSFREIGEGYCHFFTLESPESLVEELENYLFEPPPTEPGIPKPEFEWPDWKESTRELFNLTLELAGPSTGSGITKGQGEPHL